MIKLERLLVENFRRLRGVHLRFPEAGSVLIQGKNEAGKSTLFEAVYFALYGKPLVVPRVREQDSTGRTRGYETAIRYGAGMAHVELALSVGGTRLEIVRELYRDRPNRARLAVHRPDGVREEVTRIGAINQRIVQELGGIDGDTLLNSCFVEQKKLAKLEGLGLQEREAAIARLLNLDRFIEMEREFRLSTQDRDERERAKARLELAETVAEEAELEARQQELERKLTLAKLKECLEAIASREEAFRDHQARLSRLEEARIAIAGKLSQAERAKGGISLLERVLSGLGRLSDAQGALESLQGRLTELQALEESLPGREGELAELTELLAGVGRMEGWRGRLREIAEAIKRVRASLEVHAQLEDARRTLGDLGLEGARLSFQEAAERLRKARAMAALADWMRARQAEERLADLERSIGQMADEEEALLAREKEMKRRYSALGARAILGLVGLLIGFVLGLVGQGLLRVLGLSMALLSLGWGGWFSALAWKARAGATAFSRQAGTLSQRLREGRERRELAAERVKETKGRAEVEEELARLGERSPASLREADERRIALLAEPGEVNLARFEEEAQTASAILHRLEGEEKGLRERMAALEVELGGRDSAGLEEGLLRFEREEDELREAMAREEALLAPRLAARGLFLEVGPLREARGALEAGVKRLRTDVEKIPALRGEIARGEERLGEIRSGLEAGWGELARISQGLSGWWPPASLSEAAVKESLDGLGKLLQGLDEAASRREGERLSRQMGELEERRKALAEEIATKRRELRSLLAGLGHSIEGEEALLPGEGMEELFPELAQADFRERDACEADLAEVQRDLLIVRHQGQKLEEDWYLEGEELELEACREEYARLEREQAIRARAETLVAGARQRIIARVLPTTERYMERVLPLLTAGRYRLARIIQDYRIRVWDDWARRYVEKELFSGGTQDQFSLALRLGFALAAIPEEMGTRPGFVFLDEPLSSFDAERAQALVELITKGEVARHFDQVFLISHSLTFETSAFAYQLEIEEGRVLSCELCLEEGFGGRLPES